jgi:competence protein ComEA
VVASVGLLLALWTLTVSLGGGGAAFPRPEWPDRDGGAPPSLERLAEPATAPGSLSAGGAVPGATRPLDLNRADREQLATLPGIGPALAERIVADRERRGPFGDADALMRVPGIGPKRLAQVRAHLTVTEGP